MGLNPLFKTQHNKGVGGCNEGKSNAAIRQLEADQWRWNSQHISSSSGLNEPEAWTMWEAQQ